MVQRPRDDVPQPPGMPRWVKVFGLAAVAIVLLVVVVLLFSGGHGPGRHGSPSPIGIMGQALHGTQVVWLAVAVDHRVHLT